MGGLGGAVRPVGLGAWVFAWDPEAGGGGFCWRGACVEGTESCGVCDFSGGGSCSCRSGVAGGETWTGRVSDRVNDKKREERTDFPSLFGGWGGFGVGSVGGLGGFWVGDFVTVGVVFC